jgi:antirestriction protein ArdC
MNVYEVITERITAMLERGVAPWNRPWRGAANQPRNLMSGHVYRGINVFMLACSGYTSPYWLTYNQASKVGAHIRKGEKGMPVVFWKFGTHEIQDGDETVTKSSVLCRYYTVFNVEQVDGLAVPSDMLNPAMPDNPIAECEHLLAAYVGRPELRHSENRAWYSPTLDVVNMPKRELFINPESYYSTLFHEMTHSTGHSKRLDRVTLTDAGRFGDANYSKEELVAEMGAAYMSGLTGIENKTIEESASYLKGWLSRLRNDPKLLISAASQAQKAVDFMTGKAAKPVQPVSDSDHAMLTTARIA